MFQVNWCGNQTGLSFNNQTNQYFQSWKLFDFTKDCRGKVLEFYCTSWPQRGRGNPDGNPDFDQDEDFVDWTGTADKAADFYSVLHSLKDSTSFSTSSPFSLWPTFAFVFVHQLSRRQFLLLYYIVQCIILFQLLTLPDCCCFMFYTM